MSAGNLLIYNDVDCLNYSIFIRITVLWSSAALALNKKLSVGPTIVILELSLHRKKLRKNQGFSPIAGIVRIYL